GDGEPRAARGRHENDRREARRRQLDGGVDLRVTRPGCGDEGARDIRSRGSTTARRQTADDRLELRDRVRSLQDRRHRCPPRQYEPFDLDVQATTRAQVRLPFVELPWQTASGYAANRVRRSREGLADRRQHVRVEDLPAVIAADAERGRGER